MRDGIAYEVLQYHKGEKERRARPLSGYDGIVHDDGHARRGAIEIHHASRVASDMLLGLENSSVDEDKRRSANGAYELPFGLLAANALEDVVVSSQALGAATATGQDYRVILGAGDARKESIGRDAYAVSTGDLERVAFSGEDDLYAATPEHVRRRQSLDFLEAFRQHYHRCRHFPLPLFPLINAACNAACSLFLLLRATALGRRPKLQNYSVFFATLQRSFLPSKSLSLSAASAASTSLSLGMCTKP